MIPNMFENSIVRGGFEEKSAREFKGAVHVNKIALGHAYATGRQQLYGCLTCRMIMRKIGQYQLAHEISKAGKVEYLCINSHLHGWGVGVQMWCWKQL